MSVAVRQPKRMTFDEWLAFEETTEERHELINGSIFAMSGSSDSHNLIVGNLFLQIAGPLMDKCQTFQGMMKLKVDHGTDSDGYYPDIMVSCSPSDRERLFRREPVLLIEVLSPSTERTDRGEKLLNYLQIRSLHEYLIVSQDFPQIELMRRRNAWQPEFLFMNDTVVLDSVSLSFPVTAAYRTLTF